ncbi:MAG TPA: ABC transporter permease [Euzebyales bacterium]|nr:ABC transporter permease [Euzebyales bacterium]
MTGALRVMEGELLAYRRNWRASAFSTFLNPVLFLAAMGLGLGSLVDRGQGLGGLSYLAFYASGLLAAHAMMTGVGDATYPVMAGIKWIKSYQAALATPVATRDLVVGHASFILLRVAFASLAFVTVASLFGAFAWIDGLAAVPVVLLCGLAYATPVMAFTASLERETALAGLFRFGLVPMFLLSGTFFPLEQLPVWLQRVAQLVPLWHAIELVRAITLDVAPALPWAVHVAYLLTWLVVGAALAFRIFRWKLTQ